MSEQTAPKTGNIASKLKGYSLSALLIGGAITGTVLIATLMTQGAANRQATESSEAQARLLPVEASTISLAREYIQHREFPGLITARRDVDLSFQVAGQIKEFLVEEGDVVAAGDVLAALDKDRLQAQRNRLEANLAEQRASARLAQQTLDRQRNLNRQGHTSEQRLDEAVTEAQRARNAVNGIQAEIELLDVDIADAELIAPFGGTITRRILDEGTVVSVGTQVLRLIETNALEARVGLPPALAAKRQVGERLDFTWRGQEYTAVVQSILPSVGRNSRTLTIVLDLPSNLKANDGELIELILEDAVRANGVWLPNDALTEGLRGLWSVYTLAPEPSGQDHYTVNRAEVEVLYAEATRSFVSGTLEDGDLVVSTGAQRLTPGQIVRRVERDQTASMDPQG